MPKVHKGPRGPGSDEDLLPAPMGALAGTDEPHRYKELQSLGAPLCTECFGFSDDHRHFLPPRWQYVEDELCRRFENEKEWQWVTRWDQAA